jgi:hypothetical protein
MKMENLLFFNEYHYVFKLSILTIEVTFLLF